MIYVPTNANVSSILNEIKLIDTNDNKYQEMLHINPFACDIFDKYSPERILDSIEALL